MISNAPDICVRRPPIRRPVSATPASHLHCLQITQSICCPIIVSAAAAAPLSSLSAAGGSVSGRSEGVKQSERAPSAVGRAGGAARARGGASADQWRSVPRRSLFSCHRGADWGLWGGTLQPQTRAAHESPINFVPIQIILSSPRGGGTTGQRSANQKCPPV